MESLPPDIHTAIRSFGDKLILPDGLGKIAPQLQAEALAQTVFHAAAQLLCLLPLHLPHEPGKIAALEAAGIEAFVAQAFSRFKAELAACAEQHDAAGLCRKPSGRAAALAGTEPGMVP